MLASRLAVLPITILELGGFHWKYDMTLPEWPARLAYWTHVEVLRVFCDSAAEALFRILDHATAASPESSSRLFHNLKVINYDGQCDKCTSSRLTYDWPETCVRVISARNCLAKSGREVSAIECVYLQNFDTQSEGRGKHLEALKAIVAVKYISPKAKITPSHRRRRG
jgi:hypothetical protein